MVRSLRAYLSSALVGRELLNSELGRHSPLRLTEMVPLSDMSGPTAARGTKRPRTQSHKRPRPLPPAEDEVDHEISSTNKSRKDHEHLLKTPPARKQCAAISVASPSTNTSLPSFGFPSETPQEQPPAVSARAQEAEDADFDASIASGSTLDMPKVAVLDSAELIGTVLNKRALH